MKKRSIVGIICEQQPSCIPAAEESLGEKTAMKMNDIRKLLLADAYDVCPGLDELRGKPISIDDMLDFTIYEDGIKKAYDNHAKRKSIRQHMLDNGHDDSDYVYRRKMTRVLKYTQYYRDLQNELLIQRGSNGSDELVGKNMQELEKRLEGYEITAMNFYELNNIIEHPLHKKIGGRQICSSKKVPNPKFVEYMDEYDNEINRLHDSMDTPEKILFNTQAFFTCEWKYVADIVYDIVIAAEERGFPDFDVQKAMFILGTTTIDPVPQVPYRITVECRMVNARRKLIPMLFEDDMNIFSEYFFTTRAMFRLSYLLKKIPRDRSLAELVHETSLDDRVQFLKDHFWIWDKHTRKKKWTQERIKYAREIYRQILTDIPEPSIK